MPGEKQLKVAELRAWRQRALARRQSEMIREAWQDLAQRAWEQNCYSNWIQGLVNHYQAAMSEMVACRRVPPALVEELCQVVRELEPRLLMRDFIYDFMEQIGGLAPGDNSRPPDPLARLNRLMRGYARIFHEG